MATMQLIALVFALVCFVLAAANVPSRINLIGAGLAFWVATLIPGLIR